MGCFSRPQAPLLPHTMTTGSRCRTSVSASISENPAAPSPSSSTTCADGRASRAAIAYPSPVPRHPNGPGSSHPPRPPPPLPSCPSLLPPPVYLPLPLALPSPLLHRPPLHPAHSCALLPRI